VISIVTQTMGRGSVLCAVSNQGPRCGTRTPPSKLSSHELAELYTHPSITRPPQSSNHQRSSLSFDCDDDVVLTSWRRLHPHTNNPPQPTFQPQTITSFLTAHELAEITPAHQHPPQPHVLQPQTTTSLLTATPPQPHVLQPQTISSLLTVTTMLCSLAGGYYTRTSTTPLSLTFSNHKRSALS
jgi:hypothetical protein